MIGDFLHEHAAALIWTGIVCVALLPFKPFRSLMGSLISLAVKGSIESIKFLGNHLQAVLAAVFRAHVTLALNLLPRTAALPSVATPKTTRKT